MKNKEPESQNKESLFLTTLRIPHEHHEKLLTRSKETGISINTLIRMAIGEYLKKNP